eukprot:TRINITY_DN1893_c0_g2_i1.p1 TRINITY_DN1893_c0_g2~~TRINITY_DN1893_c0_g2_i1.p1  ORF type:complete len:686 (+),score=205.99 TRINITY_DN1893_c0_g2_i1:187-2244(+)
MAAAAAAPPFRLHLPPGLTWLLLLGWPLWRGAAMRPSIMDSSSASGAGEVDSGGAAREPARDAVLPLAEEDEEAAASPLASPLGSALLETDGQRRQKATSSSALSAHRRERQHAAQTHRGHLVASRDDPETREAGVHAKCCGCVRMVKENGRRFRRRAGIWSWSGNCPLQCKDRGYEQEDPEFAIETPEPEKCDTDDILSVPDRDKKYCRRMCSHHYKSFLVHKGIKKNQETLSEHEQEGGQQDQQVGEVPGQQDTTRQDARYKWGEAGIELLRQNSELRNLMGNPKVDSAVTQAQMSEMLKISKSSVEDLVKGGVIIEITEEATGGDDDDSRGEAADDDAVVYRWTEKGIENVKDELDDLGLQSVKAGTEISDEVMAKLANTRAELTAKAMAMKGWIEEVQAGDDEGGGAAAYRWTRLGVQILRKAETAKGIPVENFKAAGLKGVGVNDALTVEQLALLAKHGYPKSKLIEEGFIEPAVESNEGNGNVEGEDTQEQAQRPTIKPDEENEDSPDGGGAQEGEQEPCEDKDDDCKALATRGECEKNPDRMLVKCKLSCGVCEEDSDVPEACEDSNEQCAGWAEMGECKKNAEFMLEACKRSCGRCNAAPVMKGMSTRQVAETNWLHVLIVLVVANLLLPGLCCVACQACPFQRTPRTPPRRDFAKHGQAARGGAQQGSADSSSDDD